MADDDDDRVVILAKRTGRMLAICAALWLAWSLAQYLKII